MKNDHNTFDANRCLDYFIANKCERGPESKIKVREFRDHAFNWLTKNMVYHLDFNSTHDFLKHLESRGFAIERKVGKCPIVVGLKVKPI